MITLTNIQHHKEKYQQILKNLYIQPHLANQNKYRIKTMFYSELLEKVNLFNLYLMINDIHHINYSNYLSYQGIDSEILSGNSNTKIAVEAKNRNVQKFDVSGKYQDYEILELTKYNTFYTYHMQNYHTFYVTFYQDCTMIHDTHKFFTHVNNNYQHFITDTFHRPHTTHGFGSGEYEQVQCRYLPFDQRHSIYMIDNNYHLDCETEKELDEILK